MDDQQNFNDLLKEAGLGAYSGLFGSGKEVASAVGFGGESANVIEDFSLTSLICFSVDPKLAPDLAA